MSLIQARAVVWICFQAKNGNSMARMLWNTAVPVRKPRMNSAYVGASPAVVNSGHLVCVWQLPPHLPVLRLTGSARCLLKCRDLWIQYWLILEAWRLERDREAWAAASLTLCSASGHGNVPVENTSETSLFSVLENKVCFPVENFAQKEWKGILLINEIYI